MGIDSTRDAGAAPSSNPVSSSLGEEAMRARSLSALVLVAVVVVGFGAAVRADEASPESIRAKIAALDLDGARADLQAVTSRTKSLKDQVELKALNHEIANGVLLQKV